MLTGSSFGRCRIKTTQTRPSGCGTRFTQRRPASIALGGDWNSAECPNVYERTAISYVMTKADLYRRRASEFLALADAASDPEEREALCTFASCCLQLSERAEKYWQQRTAPQREAPQQSF